MFSVLSLATSSAKIMVSRLPRGEVPLEEHSQDPKYTVLSVVLGSLCNCILLRCESLVMNGVVLYDARDEVDVLEGRFIWRVARWPEQNFQALLQSITNISCEPSFL